jgi:hypothetical protein
MKKCGQHCDWLEKTAFEALAKDKFTQLSEPQWREFLVKYCKTYHEQYTFDRLDEAFAYLELQCETEVSVLAPEFPDIKRSVEEGRGEYCCSLNEISDAIYPLFDEKPFTLECLLKSLNHVLEAYACNESPTVFLKREDENLCNLFHTMFAKSE